MACLLAAWLPGWLAGWPCGLIVAPDHPPHPNSPPQYYFGFRIIRNKVANFPNTSARYSIIQVRPGSWRWLGVDCVWAQ